MDINQNKIIFSSDIIDSAKVFNNMNSKNGNEVNEAIKGILQEILPHASDRLKQIKYKKEFYGIPDSIFDYYFREIAFCYILGRFGACISLIGTCLENALKSELVKLYKIDDKKLLTLSLTIGKAKDKGLISNGIFDKAKGVNKIRNKYVHVNINKIKEIFDYNTYYQISDWIQEEKLKREVEPDCLEAYKNLMEILENLYSEERYPV